MTQNQPMTEEKDRPQLAKGEPFILIYTRGGCRSDLSDLEGLIAGLSISQAASLTNVLLSLTAATDPPNITATNDRPLTPTSGRTSPFDHPLVAANPKPVQLPAKKVTACRYCPLHCNSTTAEQYVDSPLYHVPPPTASQPFYVVTRGKKVGVFSGWYVYLFYHFQPTVYSQTLGLPPLRLSRAFVEQPIIVLPASRLVAKRWRLLFWTTWCP